MVGDGARLRTGTVLYVGSRIGRNFETGHHVVVREQNRIGNDVSVWSDTVVDYGCVIGHRVKIHSNCYIAQFTEIEDDAFLAPGVTIANDLYPGSRISAEQMRGPLIAAGAQIGVNVTILPYVRIGAGAIIGAGSTVTRDIPDRTIAYGSRRRRGAIARPPRSSSQRRSCVARRTVTRGTSRSSSPAPPRTGTREPGSSRSNRRRPRCEIAARVARSREALARPHPRKRAV